MKTKQTYQWYAVSAKWGVIGIIFVVLVGLACNSPTNSTDTSGTQIALNVQSTQLALKETDLAQSANLPEAQQPAAPAENNTQNDGPNLQATLDAQLAAKTAMELEATMQALAMQQTQAAQAAAPAQDNTQQQPPAQPAAGNLPDFDTWMQSASILLYEDMAADFSVYRFIELALDGMNVRYTDVRDALGHYKNQILTAGPGGNGWDLIISGKESRTAVQGEFYVYLNDALNIGSSVIIEEWDLDAIGGGKLGTILNRCGVQFQEDWFDDPLDPQMLNQLMFPVDGTHPIHHYPNEGISLTNPNGFWFGFDLGDKMSLTPGSKAQPLWVARSGEKNRHLTAVSCVDGRLIIQTYGSHSYGQDRVVMMWQNYIYNALKARYDYLSGQ